MNRSELVHAVAERFPDIPIGDIDAALVAMLDSISEAMADGQSITIHNFGTFYPGTRPAQASGLDGVTVVPPVRVARFRASAHLKRRLRNAQRELTFTPDP